MNPLKLLGARIVLPAVGSLPAILTHLLLGLLFASYTPAALAADCSSQVSAESTTPAFLHEAEASALQLQFDSGARWDLCWHIDDHVGLVLSRLSYGAPEEPLRQVMDAASLGQILLKYDEDTQAQHLLSTTGLGGAQHQPAGNTDCATGEVLIGIDEQQVCQHVKQINHMTKVRNSESIMRHELSLSAWSKIGSHTFQQLWRLSEDGEITPSVMFSGRISRYTNDPRFGIRIDDSSRLAASATLLFNWRLDFNINGTATNDRVDEVEFPATVTDVVRRSINIRHLPTETLRETDRLQFRGWRISDADQSSALSNDGSASTKIGYYLDPQTAGHNYTSRSHNWTQFDFFITKQNRCEKLASDNHLIYQDCPQSLDYYTNGESLAGADNVVWFSLSRHFTPRFEDYPAISAMGASFKLIPFDWSAHTPFTPPEAAEAFSGSEVFVGNQ